MNVNEMRENIAKKEAELDQNDSVSLKLQIARMYMQLAGEFVAQETIGEFKKYYNRGLALHEQIMSEYSNRFPNEHEARLIWSQCLFFEENYEELAEYFLKAAHFYEKLAEVYYDPDKGIHLVCNINLARQYAFVARYYAQNGEKEEYIFKAINIIEKIKNEPIRRLKLGEIGELYGHVADFYETQNDILNTEIYLLKRVSLCERLHEFYEITFEDNLLDATIKTAQFYKEQGDMEKAEKYYCRAFPLAEIIFDRCHYDKHLLVRSYRAMADFYAQTGNHSKAKECKVILDEIYRIYGKFDD